MKPDRQGELNVELEALRPDLLRFALCLHGRICVRFNSRRRQMSVLRQACRRFGRGDTA